MSLKECTPLEDEIRALHQSLEEEKVTTANLFYSTGNHNVSPLSYQQCKKKGDGSKKRSRTSKVNRNDTEGLSLKKIRKLKDISPGSPEIDDLDAHLEEIAERKNLSVHNVKNIIRNIIIDEHVVNLFTSDKPELEIPFEPKLTRSKLKELLENKNDPFLLPTSQSKASSSDTRVLIEEELPDDSSDDEYRPNEEESELRSDDESFVSSQASDIGSPAPSWTSSIPSTYNNEDSVFKKPLPIENSQEDLIVYRTRSKLPLTDTPLEHLELAFVPPDITTDMYDSDCDDEEWAKFLKEFVSAPVQQPSETADDEEADPEYNVLEEEEEVDSEELRADKAVRIPKDELEKLNRDLMAEEESGDEDESIIMGNLQPTPAEDILQTAVDEISQPASSVPLPPLEPMETAVLLKPTGVVQPLPPSQPLAHIPPRDMLLTIQYSTDGVDHSFDVRCPVKPNEEVCEIYPPEMLLPPDSKMRLEEQLRMHVQLLTQTNMIAAQDRKLTPFVEETNSMLLELTHINNRHVDIANLDEAIQLTSEWSALMKSRPRKFGKKSKYNYQRPVIEKGNKKKYVKRGSIHPERCEFDEDMVRLMMDSKVFIYPSLLPARAIFENIRTPFQGSNYEDMLIAMSLEQFEAYLKDPLLKIRKEAIRSIACQLISDYVLPHHTGLYLQSRITRLTKTTTTRPGNPLQYYRLHKRAPPLASNELIPFDRTNMRKLRDVSPPCLPERWRVFSLRDLHRRSLTQRIETPVQLPKERIPSPFDRSIFFLRDKVVAFDDSVEEPDEVTENSIKTEQDQNDKESVSSNPSASNEELLEDTFFPSRIFQDDNSPPSSVLESSPASRQESRVVTPPPKRRPGRPRKVVAEVTEAGPRKRRRRRTAQELLVDDTPAKLLPKAESNPSSEAESEEGSANFPKRKRSESPGKSEPVTRLLKRKRRGLTRSTPLENSTAPATSGSFAEKRKRGRPKASLSSSGALCPTAAECLDKKRRKYSRRRIKEPDTQSVDEIPTLENPFSSDRKSPLKSLNEPITITLLDDSDKEIEPEEMPMPQCEDEMERKFEWSGTEVLHQEYCQVTNNHPITKILPNDEPTSTKVKVEMSNSSEHKDECSIEDLSSSDSSREAFVGPMEVERQPDDMNLSSSSSNNISTIKRFVLVKRDSNGLSCTHVWGPGSLQGNVIPVQTVADKQDDSAAGSTSASTNDKNPASSSSTSQVPISSASAVKKEISASGCGGDDGDDGEKRPEDKALIDAADDSECREPMVEDEEEEEESVQLDTLTATPRATQVAPSKGRSPAHRLVKNQRNASRILDSWMADKNSNSTDYAAAYFEKVTTSLKKNPEAHSKFISTLESFDPDRPSEYILQLYNEISKILEPHPDLLEEFVVFIGPECAASCGKEFEYFLYSQMRNFFFEIKSCLRQSQLKRVLNALQQVENSESHSINDIKSAILPLLKGYSHLTNSFLKLFLDDIPPPSVDMDFEEVNLDQQTSGDEFEYVDLTEGAVAATGSNQGQGKENEAKSSSRRVVAGGSNKSNVAKGKGKGKALKK